MAAASVYVMTLDKSEYRKQTQPMLSHINLSYGDDLAIRELKCLVEIGGFEPPTSGL